jgi:uncharacterized protein YukE
MNDGDQIRAVASRVSGTARDLRGHARRTASAQGVDWRGDASGRYRKQLSDTGARLYSLASEIDSLAAALRAYARTVERRQRAAAGVIGDVTDAVVGAASDVAGTVRHAADGLR